MTDRWDPLVDSEGAPGAERFVARLGDRSLFPRLKHRAYLNHAAISPPSIPVLAASAEVLHRYERHGSDAWGFFLHLQDVLRARLARLIGATEAEIALTPNTTRGVVDAALCFPFKAGDRVILFEGEFPTNVTPWQQAARREGLSLTFLPASSFASDEGLATLGAELDKGDVRLVAVSAVQFSTGLAMPLERMGALCRARGASLFVDAIQAAGAVPLDVEAMQIDMLAAGSHKWLMGTVGAGFLYVRRSLAERLVPNSAGWLSHEDPLPFLFEGPGHLRYDRPFKKEARFFESGAFGIVSLAGLDAALALIEGLGVPAIAAHVSAYHDALEAGLLELGFESVRPADPSRRSCILSVIPPGGRERTKALQAALMAEGIACTMPDGYLRFAPHWPNALAEVPVVVEAVRSVLDGSAAKRC